MPPTRPRESGTNAVAEWRHALEQAEHRQKKLGQDVGALSEAPLTPLSEPACQVDAEELYRFGMLISSLHINPENGFHAQIRASLLEVGRFIARLRPEDLEVEREHQQRLREAAIERDEDISDARFELHQVLSDVEAKRAQLVRIADSQMSCSAARAAKARLDRVALSAGEALNRLGNTPSQES